MKKVSFNLITKLFATVTLFVTSLAYSQATPSLTLTTSLESNISCANTPFTLTVSDSTLGQTTTYTLSYGTFLTSQTTNTGIVTFTLAGVATETTISVNAENPKGNVISTTIIYVPRLETLGTGSTYANTDMDGTMVGVGFTNSFDNGTFLRVEGTMMDFGSASVTASNTDNKVELKELEGGSAKISFGKSF